MEGYLGGDSGRLLPLLPATNAARAINEDVAPVAGAGTSGVRFVASYAQGIVPVSANNITYLYLGLTPDRKYYIEGTFPVALVASLPPAPSPVTAETAQSYNAVVAGKLRDAGASGFLPTLDKLDTMMGRPGQRRAAAVGAAPDR